MCYYHPTKAVTTIQERFAEPIKALIEEHPSFGYRTVAHLLCFNKDTVQRVYQLMRWKAKFVGHLSVVGNGGKEPTAFSALFPKLHTLQRRGLMPTRATAFIIAIHAELMNFIQQSTGDTRAPAATHTSLISQGFR